SGCPVNAKDTIDERWCLREADALTCQGRPRGDLYPEVSAHIPRGYTLSWTHQVLLRDTVGAMA
ncbi:MAG: hypothetical protein NWQ78_00195, partial [Pontimonas sp.]|nr:hypothetical protein [Pontimonas sp.]